MKKFVLFSILAMMLQSSIALCHTWETVNYGYWNHSSVWASGVIPPYSNSDTFLIRHPVAIENNVELNSSAYFIIDSTGGICGHKNITVNSGAKLIKYGILELDTLKIPGGIVNLNAPEPAVLTLYGIISNGGVFQVNGCSLQVGPWFGCRQPDFFFTLGVQEQESQNGIFCFPNPASSSLNIKIERPLSNTTHISIFNSIGTVVLQQTVNKGLQNITLNIENLSPGLYYLNIGGYSGKFVKQ